MEGKEELLGEAALLKQQRKEKKDLQAKIQSMKNSVPKNDKKRRKQLTEDIAKLESEMDERHKQELEALAKNEPEQAPVDNVVNGVSNLDLDSGPLLVQQPRVSKAQKRREKKAALEKERDERIAEAEIENLSGARHLENQTLTHSLAERQLQIKQIPSDGHCMYRAIEHQLKEQDNGLTLSNLRSQTADYMRKHADDFLPFLTNASTNEMFSEEEFEKYCNEIASTPAWGGQLELRALSHVLKTPIEVIQAGSPPIVIGEEYSSKPITLVYMRHAYGLGEHYNSVEPLMVTSSDDG
ncbi:OTU domain-containing 6B [Pelobates cultripes]|uniref:Deubiquitinase OTUD6B n=1 Tax=Pelobates cultripes TaxID=61616 RepID=A0AAD1S1E8_PELCU|nr:OTU domain-containing 6B [Pelobates cultripes]